MKIGDEYLEQNRIVAHEPASQWLARRVNRARAEAEAQASPIVPHATEDQREAIVAELAEFWASFPGGIVPRQALRQKIVDIREKYGA